jgi:hypothetical protein
MISLKNERKKNIQSSLEKNQQRILEIEGKKESQPNERERQRLK